MRRLIVGAILLFCSGIPLTTASAEDVTVATGKTFIDVVFDPIKESISKKGTTVIINFSKPVEALQKIDSGIAELGGASLTPSDWLEMASKAGANLKNKDNFIFYKIIEEETVVIVNLSNPIKTLTKEQAKEIFSGKVQNWKEVGGNDSPILVVWPAVVGGSSEIFLKKVMDGTPLTKDLLEVPTISNTAEAVASNAEAISIINGSSDKTVKSLEAPRLLRPLTLASNGKPTVKAQKLLDYLQGEGKAFFRK